MGGMKWTIYTIAIIGYFTRWTHSDCRQNSLKKLQLNLASRRNETGHWTTEITANLEGEVPRAWTVKVKRLSTECQGDNSLRLSAIVTVPPPRPKDYEFFPKIGYYKFHDDYRTWEEAKNICEEEGGHLAIVNSEDESKVLKSLFARHSDDDNWAFVGFHDRYNEGEYVTIFGDPLNKTKYTRWSSKDQPDDSGGEDCGCIHRNGGLNDISCDSELYFICEYELW